MQQGRAENFKSAIQNSSAVATFDSQWKIFQKSALQPSSQICKRIFSSYENIYVSFIGAKAKTRATGSLGRNWARLAVMDGLVQFDPPDEPTSAHAGMIKELLDMRDGINECLHLSRTEIEDLIYHL